MDTRVYTELYTLEKDYWWHQAKRKIVFETLTKRQKGRNHIRILDAGCGTGIMLSELLEQFPNSLGVDHSTVALNFCKKRGLSNIHRGDLEKKLPFKGSSFDVVTCLDVIEHLDHDDKAIKEFQRILKPGGELIITVPAYMALWTKHDEMLWHKRRYRRGQLAKLAKDHGFKIEKASYFYSFIAPVAFVLYRLGVMFKSRKSSSSVIPPKPFNWLLLQVCALERRLIDIVPMPTGISILLVAQKPKERKNK